MQWLAEICVRRPIFATVLILLILVIGTAGYVKLGVDRFPNVDLPIVVVTTRLPGAAPEDVETEISDKVEEAVNTISGIDELTSISSEGVSQVIIRFVLEKSTDVASQEVRDRLQLIMQDLPKGIDLPTVQKMDPDASPIIQLALKWDGHAVQEVTELADKRVRRALETVNGVGQVAIVGGQKRQVNVWLDPVRMRGSNVTALDVQRAIANQNLTVPGGRVDTGPEQLTLRIHGRVERASEIGGLVVRQEAGHSILVRDVGRVEDGAEERETSALLNGEPTIILAIRKQSGSNTVQVVDQIRERLGDVRKGLPQGASLDVIRDDSGVIRTSVGGVKEHLVVGAILAAIVVFFFLGSGRSTIIAATAIPTSIVGTFALMWFMGYTLNTITLLALALAVGIVIDDAIVVLENIFRYVDEKGFEPAKAAVAATKEIGLAVLATTLSLIAVFLPVAFLGGIPGRFLASFGVTMAFSIAVSLVVSFSLTPMLAARWLKRKAPGAKKPLGERIVDAFYRPVERIYMVMLGFVLRHRWIVFAASALSLAGCFPLAGAARKGFLPSSDEAQFEVVVRAPEGTSLAQTQLITNRIATQLRTWPTVALTVATVGDDAAKTQNVGRIYTRLSDPRDRKETQNELMNKVRTDIFPRESKDLRLSVQEVAAFGGGFSTAKIQYTVRGPDLKKLESITASVLGKLRQVPGAVDVDSSLISGKPELGVYIDRPRAADLGVSVADTASTLRVLVDGEKVSTYEEKGEQYDVRVRAEPQYRATTTGLEMLTLPSPRLGLVPLRSVVDIKRGAGPATINHLNRQRVVTLLSNVKPGFSDGAIADAVAKIIKEEHLSAEYIAEPTGQTREMGRVFISFGAAIGLSFIFMYLVLAAQFESWLHPVTILLSLPLTLPFAVASVVIFKQSLDIFSGLGILVLFGVVKKNAILQIDHTNHLRAGGMARHEAILEANRDRLRPILMTTLAFVAGMLPLVLSKGIGASNNQATGGVVVGGQTLSLLLTLLATPVAYTVFDDISNLVARIFGRKKVPDAPQSGNAPAHAAEE
ncbi:RND multidrug efflux transporter [Labilithrix luteola]|uniref:RND multidrug efflux transporter n=1 Tax=Labilithrix luteola TaxID=1391654 RepID=A0A0K1Q4M2_9BACT|nr:efflux RND transporter permease subunit [Labilithrix luteola]AKV00761.1 RND multidrug efflux transporter [Labilithrix luteola]